jgi:2,3-bisphosphoglycerate-independent phosphoglycerate mutase
VIHLNFRADRARQLTQALAFDAFEGFDRGSRPTDLPVTTLTEYQAHDELPVAVGFPPLAFDSLAAELSRRGMRQLHVAETEKYAHVTYFFNGGREEPFPGEDRILVPSPRDVPSYDHKPEMSARGVTTELVAALERTPYAFMVVNFANPDMVGHTGVIPAVVQAVETADACLADVLSAVEARGGVALVTADHGNAEKLLQDDGKSPHTAHTTNPVPLVITQNGATLRDGGELSDLAPTVLDLLDLPQPERMTGISLIRY